jgi:hypothetical protein
MSYARNGFTSCAKYMMLGLTNQKSEPSIGTFDGIARRNLKTNQNALP